MQADRHFNFNEVIIIVFSSLDNGLRFMSISLLVLVLWQFLHIKDLPKNLKIQKYQMFGGWSELGILNLSWVPLIYTYLRLDPSYCFPNFLGMKAKGYNFNSTNTILINNFYSFSITVTYPNSTKSVFTLLWF